MEKTMLFCLIALAGILAVSCPAVVDGTPGPSPTPPPPGSYTVQVIFSEYAQNSGLVYAAWIEDESGNNIQNIYVCTRAGENDGLMGEGLPYYKRTKYTQNSEIDAVTAASYPTGYNFDEGFEISRMLSIQPRRFRICIDIDRGDNGNYYFKWDRPAFSYSTDIIDLDALQISYDFILRGWMSNENGQYDANTQYSQQPLLADGITDPEIPHYGIFEWMTDLTFIAPIDTMVTSLTATITQN